MRIGMGYDVHRLQAGCKLIMGGVEIPYEKGLLGHSDADVLVHAVMDALLGAAALGDIGKHFPDTDPAYKGISSILLLQKVGELLEEHCFLIENIDATIIAQAPKMRPHIDQMRQNMADALKIDVSQINVKATTEEGLGFTGAGEGISAQAICLLNSPMGLYDQNVTSGCGGCGGGCGSHQPSFEGPNVGKICRTHYRGTFNDGSQFDSSYDRGEPLEFTCGAGQMILGFDKAVATMEVGEKVTVHLMPEEAYGMSDPNAIFTVEIAQLPGSEDLTVGQQVYLSNQYGQPFPVKVNAKDEKTITFDANHEMAGKELNFEIELVEVK